MRRAWLGRTLVGLAVAALALGPVACTSVVPGHATAAPPTVPAAGSTAPPATAVPAPGPRAGLHADPLPDECLLNASEFGALVGGPVRPPAQGAIERGDGTHSSSCVATAEGDPVAMINVYTVRAGTPADYVRAAGPTGRRDLPGIGAAAVVIDTQTGPTLQLASLRYLVTILVSGSTPSDEAWRAAALAALSRLPA